MVCARWPALHLLWLFRDVVEERKLGYSSSSMSDDCRLENLPLDAGAPQRNATYEWSGTGRRKRERKDGERAYSCR
jgi:hypothetical protein